MRALQGFFTVLSITGAVVAGLLVLFIVGTVNNHTKGMAAVGDGFVDVLKWAAYLGGRGLSLL